MPLSFLLGCGVLVLFLWLKRRRGAITRHDVAQALRAFAAVFGSMATTGLAIGGRYGLAVVTLLATLAACRSLFNAWQTARAFGGEARQTRTETGSLAMRIDLDTGEMDGVVKIGSFAGVLLSLLALEQLLMVRDEIRMSDAPSMVLIDAYLDHAFPEWRQFGDGFEEAPIDEARALEILGLSGRPSVDEIKRAHKELMGRVHPDRGGSSHLAAQVNAAKDLLLSLHET